MTIPLGPHALCLRSFRASFAHQTRPEMKPNLPILFDLVICLGSKPGSRSSLVIISDFQLVWGIRLFDIPYYSL